MHPRLSWGFHDRSPPNRESEHVLEPCAVHATQTADAFPDVIYFAMTATTANSGGPGRRLSTLRNQSAETSRLNFRSFQEYL